MNIQYGIYLQKMTTPEISLKKKVLNTKIMTRFIGR